MIKLVCDKCKKEFMLTAPGTSIVKDDILKHWFYCPHCKHEYVSYYTNSGIRNLQAMQQTLRKSSHRNKRKTKGKLSGLQVAIKTGMVRLKNEIESTPF